MLTDKECIARLYELADLFNNLTTRKEWTKAKIAYNKAFEVAMFMEIPSNVKDELFGVYAGDVGEHETPPDGLFKRETVAKVNMECCIKRQQAYEDIAARKLGQATRYYRDEDYCAGCRKAKK